MGAQLLLSAGALAIRAMPLLIAALAAQHATQDRPVSIKTTSDEANEGTTAKTSAPTATGRCQNCQPNDNCGKWLDQVKKALYSAKKPKEIGGDGFGNKGLKQMLCEWINGTNPYGSNHKQAVTDMLTSLNNAYKKLSSPDNGCTTPTEIENDIDKIYETIDRDGSGLDDLPHTPRDDFKEFCHQHAASYSQKHLHQYP